MSSRSRLLEIEDLLTNIIGYALKAQKDLPCITLKKADFETFKKYNRPDYTGSFYFKNVPLKKGLY